MDENNLMPPSHDSALLIGHSQAELQGINDEYHQSKSSAVTRSQMKQQQVILRGCHRRGSGRNAKSLVKTDHSIKVTSLIMIILLSSVLAQAQCPEKTMTSFERIGGVTIKDGGAPLGVLYQANVSSSAIVSTLGLGPSMVGSSLAAAAAAANSITPITAECNNRCRRSHTCRAFLVDYSRHICWSVEQLPSSSLKVAGGTSSSVAGNNQQSTSSSSSSSLPLRAPIPIHLAPTSERTAYFEKVCLNLPLVECERAWIYERVMAYQLHGHDDKLIDDVPTRLKCQEHCLNEREFKCRSGEYDYLTMQCRLSTMDRHMKPSLFRPTSSNIDYFENQCVSIGAQCDAFDRFDDLDLGRAEIMRHANTSEQCQQYCTQTIKAFICRSYTWSPLTGRCYLNSANTQMVGGIDKLISAPGLVYYQRNECIDLKLECDTASMTLNLRTSEPFRGRMYVRDEPNACETQGRSALVSSLSIPFQSQGARCATRELPSRYSSVVVVQQHPLIQRKSDRYIKLVCDFQTSNKTIMSSYNVMSNPWTSTALINATSFAPKIRLRITDKFGNDITGAKLGDELQLRIEAETDSVYDMVARSVLARSGTTDESIVLIDHDGCPADYRIFPPLKKINKRTIIGRFDAFKFSSDVVVRFQVDVQFCLNSCPAPNCPIATALLESASASANQQQQQQQNQQQSQLMNTASGQSSLAGPPTSLFNVNTQQLPPESVQTQASLSSQNSPASSSTSTTSTTSAPNTNNRDNINLPLASQPDSDSSATGGNGLQSDQSVVSPGRKQQSSSVLYNSMGERRGPVNQPAISMPIANSQDSALDGLQSGQNFDNLQGAQQRQMIQQTNPMANGQFRHQFQPNHHQILDQQGRQAYPAASQQDLSGPELAVALNQAEQLQDQNAHKASRRRRWATVRSDQSSDGMTETRHVPLQREIIVMESSSSSQKEKEKRQQQSNGKPSSNGNRSAKASGKQTFGEFTKPVYSSSLQDIAHKELNEHQACQPSGAAFEAFE